MPSVGSSSTSSFGRVTSARPIASCCCWPPERSPPRRPEHTLQHREQLEDFVGDVSLIALERRVAGLEIFFDSEQRKDFATLRHIAKAAAGALMRREAGNVLPLPNDLAGTDRLMADNGAQQRGLADAVAAENAGDAAGPGGQRDAAQRLRRAVEEIDGFDLSICAFKRASKIDLHDARIGADRIDRPFGQHRTFVQNGDLHTELAHKIHVVLDDDDRMILAMALSRIAVCTVSESVMPATGSSTSNSFGSCASSMPISSHCF